MLKKIFNAFKKSTVPEDEEIFLSKIDKHMNFLLRDRLGNVNKSINEKIVEITDKKEETIVLLRELHKAKLMNANIPEREIQIMEGNRENYIKRVSHTLTNINIPKNYLDTHDYCVQFSKEIEQLTRDIQKNIFVLQHFFGNEVKNTNKAIHELEEEIISIRVLLEKNGITHLKEVQQDIKKYIENLIKIKSFKEQITSEKHEIGSHQDKMDKLNERIKTITNGPDYKALENFRQEKGAAENEIKDVLKIIEGPFSTLETAIRKYYYMYPDKKLIKIYLEDIRNALIEDQNLDILEILRGMKGLIENDSIDLKDRKKEHCLESINKLDMTCLKDVQSKILKLEDQKHRAQTKITHNSASLNLSEQQYWISATSDKVKYHTGNIEKLEKNINTVDLDNARILSDIKTDLEKLMDKQVKIIDDISEGILAGNISLEDNSSVEN